MTRLTYPQEKNTQSMPNPGTKATESEQILYLKRLLVTLKLQFEKNLQTLGFELQQEQSKNQTLEKELDQVKLQLKEANLHHEEELEGLKEQLLTLRDLLKKSEQQNSGSSLLSSTNTDNELEDELAKKQNKIIELETILESERQAAQKELEQLRASLAFFKDQDDKQELITSNNSSYQLRQEVELIKQTLVLGAQEAKTLEIRYAELFNEKILLDHQVQLLTAECHQHVSKSTELKSQIENLEQQNKCLNDTVTGQEARLVEEIKIQAELSDQVQRLQEKCNELFPIQEKYEQLKEEYLQLSNQMDETIELRLKAEEQLIELNSFMSKQTALLIDKEKESQQLVQEREHLFADIQHLHELLADAESRLKIAQQHLAKKVKEAAMLVEKVEEHQNDISQYLQIIENDKTQINQLQSYVENYQKQEKKLQEQLHEALKGTEIQVAKWEKKYFEMYEKWQTTENQVRELKKFEEKHHQVQNLLSNLGNFMGSSFSPSQLFHAMSADMDSKSLSFPESYTTNGETLPTPKINEHENINHENINEEQYDMFGMSQNLNKPKPQSVS